MFCARLFAATIAVLALAIASYGPAHAQQGKRMTTPSGLQIIDTTVGTGPSPKRGQTAVVHYTGWLYENGDKFSQKYL